MIPNDFCPKLWAQYMELQNEIMPRMYFNDMLIKLYFKVEKGRLSKPEAKKQFSKLVNDRKKGFIYYESTS